MTVAPIAAGRARLRYAACFLAYHVVLAIPVHWRLWWTLLPMAGEYAYWDVEVAP